MNDQRSTDPTTRFSGLADIYARHRPSYPMGVLTYLLDRAGVGPGSIAVDVGAGTGISTRLLAELGLQVIGIEPNDDMRQQAERSAPTHGCIPPVYQTGRGEETGCLDGFADLVLAAQAFHWFDPDKALVEFRRILKSTGWVGLLWNQRDESDPMTRAYGDVMRTEEKGRQVEARRAVAGEVLLTSPLYSSAERKVFSNRQWLNLEELQGRAFSVSYLPESEEGKQAWRTALQMAFRQHEKEGRISLTYDTILFSARVKK